MKNQVLDTPFRDSFPDFLEKGETLLWEGQPSNKSLQKMEPEPNNYSDHSQNTFWVFYTILIIVLIYNGGSIGAIVAMILIGIFSKVIPFLFSVNKNNYKYAITPKQVLFEIKKNYIGKKKIHTIPLTEIKDIILVMAYDLEKIQAEHEEVEDQMNQGWGGEKSKLNFAEGAEKIGTIFIVPKHPEKIDFETVNLENNERRHLPSLEYLDNAAEIVALLKKEIKKIKA